MQATKEALDLFLQGSHAFARMEHNGIRIDVPYLENAIKTTGERIKELERKLTETKIFGLWRKKHGIKASLTSGPQLADMLYNELGFHCEARTDKGNAKRDKTALEKIDDPFVRDYRLFADLKKTKSTFLEGIKSELMGGMLHPSFNLHTVLTYRSSSNSINFQNFPARDAELAELVRRSFISRWKKGRLLEVDFKTLEVGIGCCYHEDKEMIRYVSDKTLCMHRDSAVKAYKLDERAIDKKWWKEKEGGGADVRYCAKNKFVFPQFYGSFYVDCAIHLWEAIDRMKLKAPDGTPLKKHLRSKGIKSRGLCDENIQPERGTFEKHLQEVERHFWDVRFPVYKQWKWDQWNEYLRQGCYSMKTGFVIRGVYNRNQVANGAIQGSAFHCLLWTLIQLDKWLRKHRMKSLIVGQVHDSMLLDVIEDEYEDVLRHTVWLATKALPKAWPWIIVPLSVEAEAAPVGGSWFDKKPVELAV